MNKINKYGVHNSTWLINKTDTHRFKKNVNVFLFFKFQKLILCVSKRQNPPEKGKYVQRFNGD